MLQSLKIHLQCNSVGVVNESIMQCIQEINGIIEFVTKILAVGNNRGDRAVKNSKFSQKNRSKLEEKRREGFEPLQSRSNFGFLFLFLFRVLVEEAYKSDYRV